jgi:hypothetical protein
MLDPTLGFGRLARGLMLVSHDRCPPSADTVSLGPLGHRLDCGVDRLGGGWLLAISTRRGLTAVADYGDGQGQHAAVVAGLDMISVRVRRGTSGD